MFITKEDIDTIDESFLDETDPGDKFLGALILGSALIGGIGSFASGDGFLTGALRGANVINQAFKIGGDLFKGRFDKATMSFLGVSDARQEKILEAKSQGKDPIGAFVSGFDINANPWVGNFKKVGRNIKSVNKELGMNLLGTILTYGGGKLLSKIGANGTTSSSSFIPFTLGRILGSENADKMYQVTGSLYGASASPDRFNTKDPSALVDLGQNFSAITDDIEKFAEENGFVIEDVENVE